MRLDELARAFLSREPRQPDTDVVHGRLPGWIQDLGLESEEWRAAAATLGLSAASTQRRSRTEALLVGSVGGHRAIVRGSVHNTEAGPDYSTTYLAQLGPESQWESFQMEPTSGWMRRLRTPTSRTVRFNDPEFDRLFTVRSGDLNIVRMHLDATRRRTIIAASDNERPDWTVVDGWVVRSSAALARDASLIVENTRFVVHIAMAIAGR